MLSDQTYLNHTLKKFAQEVGCEGFRSCLASLSCLILSCLVFSLGSYFFSLVLSRLVLFCFVVCRVIGWGCALLCNYLCFLASKNNSSQRQIWEVQLDELKTETKELKNTVYRLKAEAEQHDKELQLTKDTIEVLKATLVDKEEDVRRKQDLLEKARNAEATLKFQVNTMTSQHEEAMVAEEQRQEELQQKIASFKSKEQKLLSQIKKLGVDNEAQIEKLQKRHEDDLHRMRSEGDARVNREKAKSKQLLAKIAELEKLLNASSAGTGEQQRAQSIVEPSIVESPDILETESVQPIIENNSVEVENEDSGDMENAMNAEDESAIDQVQLTELLSDKDNPEDEDNPDPEHRSGDGNDIDIVIEDTHESKANHVEINEYADVVEETFDLEVDNTGDESSAPPANEEQLDVIPSPKPSASSPKPSASSPKPSAPSPKPSAPSPKPSAPSPIPSAPSPKSSAPSPKPSAPSQKPSVPSQKLSAEVETIKPAVEIEQNPAPAIPSQDPTVAEESYLQLQKEYNYQTSRFEELRRNLDVVRNECDIANLRYESALREVNDYKQIKEMQASEIQNLLLKIDALNLHLDSMEDGKALLMQEIFTLKRRVENAKAGGKVDELHDKLDEETQAKMQVERQLKIKAKEVEVYREQCLETGKQLFNLSYFNESAEEFGIDFEGQRGKTRVEQFDKIFEKCATSSVESILYDLRNRAKSSEDLLKSRLLKLARSFEAAQKQNEDLHRFHEESKVVFTGENDEKLKEALKVQISLRLMVRTAETKLVKAMSDAEKTKEFYTQKTADLEKKVNNLEKQKAQLFDEGKEARFLLNNATRDLRNITEERAHSHSEISSLKKQIELLTAEERRLTEWIATLEQSKRGLMKELSKSEAEVKILVQKEKDRKDRRVDASAQCEQNRCNQEVQTNFVSPHMSLRQANSSFRFPAALSFNQPPGIYISSEAKAGMKPVQIRRAINLPSLAHSASMEIVSPAPIESSDKKPMQSRSIGERGWETEPEKNVHLKIPRVEIFDT